jgi:hypothetical protein
MILLLPTSLVQPCYSAPLVSDWYSPFPPFASVECGGVGQIQVLPNLEGENFCVQFLFVDEFFKLSMFLGNGV